jgi:hypothetical protein
MVGKGGHNADKTFSQQSQRDRLYSTVEFDAMRVGTLFRPSGQPGCFPSSGLSPAAHRPLPDRLLHLRGHLDGATGNGPTESSTVHQTNEALRPPRRVGRAPLPPSSPPPSRGVTGPQDRHAAHQNLCSYSNAWRITGLGADLDLAEGERVVAGPSTTHRGGEWGHSARMLTTEVGRFSTFGQSGWLRPASFGQFGHRDQGGPLRCP